MERKKNEKKSDVLVPEFCFGVAKKRVVQDGETASRSASSVDSC